MVGKARQDSRSEAHWQHGSSTTCRQKGPNPTDSVQDDVRWSGVRAQARVTPQIMHQSNVAADCHAPLVGWPRGGSGPPRWRTSPVTQWPLRGARNGRSSRSEVDIRAPLRVGKAVARPSSTSPGHDKRVGVIPSVNDTSLMRRGCVPDWSVSLWEVGRFSRTPFSRQPDGCFTPEKWRPGSSIRVQGLSIRVQGRRKVTASPSPSFSLSMYMHLILFVQSQGELDCWSRGAQGHRPRDKQLSRRRPSPSNAIIARPAIFVLTDFL